MSDALPRTRWQSINATPLRDLLRGRVTARLDWPARLAATGLPADVSALVVRVIRRTRLWRLERAAVADELIAHFADAAAAGAADPVADFGDERAAARLIRRAKRRGRPLVWHLWTWTWRTTAVAIATIVAIDAGLTARFLTGRPTPTVDYVARLAAAERAVPADDRAWPLWRPAVLACTAVGQFGERHVPEVLYPQPGETAVPSARVAWLRAHADALAVARRAAAKPALGFILGPGGSADDPELFPVAPRQTWDEPLVEPGGGPAGLRFFGSVAVMSRPLSADAQWAADTGDGNRCVADLWALLGLAGQIRGAGDSELFGVWGVGADQAAVDRLGGVLVEHPGVLSDAALVRLAHGLAGPQVAADLIRQDGDRRAFADFLQRVYTDDGHGDGRMTWAGLRALMHVTAAAGDPGGTPPGYLLLGGPIAAVTVSRAEAAATFDRLMDAAAAGLARPLRQVHGDPIVEERMRWDDTPVGIVRYGPVRVQLSSTGAAQERAERYLGSRDGLLCGLALELYHRRHGRYPAALAELTPGLLPAVPADRITGDPVRYRLVGGRPVVYSVGADHVDDGGRRPAESSPRLASLPPDAAAQWGESAADAPRGDWVLYPPAGSRGEGD